MPELVWRTSPPGQIIAAKGQPLAPLRHDRFSVRLPVQGFEGRATASMWPEFSNKT